MVERASLTMVKRLAFIPLVYFLLATHFSFADVRLPALFSDNMVIQREMNIPVWGWADPGERVTVKIGDYLAETVTGREGKWKVRIGPFTAGGPFDLLITGKNEIRITNVLVGEVWVASGQSNMAMEVRSCLNPDEEISRARYPMIRHFQVKRTKALVPLEDVASVSGSTASWLNAWEICDPSTAGHFSGTAYFFARNLYETLNIPVGIIHTSWGGTTAEAWTPRDTLENDPELKAILNDWPAYNDDEEWLKQEYERFIQELNKARLEGKTDPLYFNQPSVLYNGMIAPVIPYGMRGVIWYQGESNAYRACQYRELFPAMITQWRRKWEQGDFPFLFVQLANYHFEPQVFPALREAQSMTLKLPQTAMAVTIDIGDSTDIHPKNKQEVGRRLFLAAQKMAYGEDILFSGPMFKKLFTEGNQCRLLFDCLGDGLVSKGGGALKGFSIAGANQVFVEARTRIEGDQVIVWNEEIDRPVAVRYAWANHPVACNLYNQSGGNPYLPASPFRTDDWTETYCRTSQAIQQKPAAVPPVPDSLKDELARTIEDNLQNMELYSFSKDIINGTKWTYQKIYKGNPFISEEYWPVADLVYRGVQYSGFNINYDLYNKNLILLYNDNDIKKYVVLSNKYLESFSYTDTVSRQKHRYEYFSIPGTNGKELYEKVYGGKTPFNIRPMCEIKYESAGIFSGEYFRSYEYYIQVDGKYERIHSKKTLLNALKRDVPQIKKFIRKNRLKIDRKHPENIVPVLKYYDELALMRT
jgi:sialate O-acetylesterase